MKFIFLTAALLLGSQVHAAEKKEGNGRPDVYSTRILYVKPDVTFDQAKKTFEGLNVVLAKAKGFEKRNVFFDADQKVWIDQIKWKHSDAAKAGMKNLAGDPAFTNITKIIDEKRIVEFHGERINEYDAPK